MAADELAQHEAAMELDLYRQYADLVHIFRYIVHTERRTYLANEVSVQVANNPAGEVYFDVAVRDAWVWDPYGQARFVRHARVLTFRDVNVEELLKPDTA